MDHIDLESSNGSKIIPSVVVRCPQCGEEAEVYGDSDASVRRGCAQLREQCPFGAVNFYVAPEYD